MVDPVRSASPGPQSHNHVANVFVSTEQGSVGAVLFEAKHSAFGFQLYGLGEGRFMESLALGTGYVVLLGHMSPDIEQGR